MSSIHFSNIIREGRVRRDYSNVPSLAQSLYSKGFIHPLCINHDRELIAGGRRSAALELLLFTPDQYPPDKAHHSMVGLLTSWELEFGVHYTHRTTDTIDELAELELIENIERQNFSWQEEVLATRKIHQLKIRAVSLGQIPDCTSWGQKQTGRLLNTSQANISYALTLANELDDVDSPLWKCGSVTEALQLLTTRKLDAASKRLAEEVKTRASTLPVLTKLPVSSVSDLINEVVATHNPATYQSGGGIGLDLSEFGVTPITPSTTLPDKVVEAQPTLSEADKVNLTEAATVVSKFIHNLDILQFCERLGKESVDHVICDPPYGIEMSNLAQSGGQGMKDIDRIEETHDVEDNLKNFPLWLEACHSIVRPNGFCIWFCDAFHFRYLHDLGEKLGFKVCRWPFHWIKTTQCMNQAAAFNFTKAVEHAIIFRKSSGARLVSAQPTNYWIGGLTVEDKAALPNHPFIKPLGLWHHLAHAVALPGATIADPFSGVGSSTRAFLKGGWQPVSGEKDPVHYSNQIHNIMNTYQELRTAGDDNEVPF